MYVINLIIKKKLFKILFNILFYCIADVIKHNRRIKTKKKRYKQLIYLARNHKLFFEFGINNT